MNCKFYQDHGFYMLALVNRYGSLTSASVTMCASAESAIKLATEHASSVTSIVIRRADICENSIMEWSR